MTHFCDSPLNASAVSVISGLMVTQQSCSASDAQMLLDSFMADARAEGVEDGPAWLILFQASMFWNSQLRGLLSHTSGRSPEQIMGVLGLASAGWATNG